MGNGSPEAGWYSNPEGDGERYWDGNQWTDQYRDEPWNPQARIDELAEALPMKLGVRKELKTLPSYLNEGEDVAHLTSGSYNGKAGLIVATDRRVLFLSAGLMGSQFEDIPLSKITSVQQSSAIMSASVVVHASGTKVEISNVIPKEAAKSLAEYVRARTSDRPPATSSEDAAPAAAEAAEAPTASSEPDVANQIRKLAELRDEGLLTDEEFDAKKKELLGL